MPWLKNNRAWNGLSVENRLRKRFLGFCVLQSGLLGCWAWRGDLATPGRFAMGDGKVWKANRASWVLFIGPLAADMDVLHHCDCPGCASPLHIYQGHDSDNTRDRMERGRGRGRWSKSPPVESRAWSDADFCARFLDNPEKIAEFVAAVRGIAGLPDKTERPAEEHDRLI